MPTLSRTVALGATCLVAALAGCGTSGGDDQSSDAPASAGDGPKRVGVLFPGDIPYTTGYLRGLRSEAKAQGVELDIVNAGFEADVQATQMDDVLAKDPDGIIVWAVDQKGIVPSLAKAARADVPIVASNSEVDDQGKRYLAGYTGPNDAAEGGVAAELMHEQLDGSGDVAVILGVPGTAPAVRRLAGFKERLQQLGGGVKVVATQPGDWDKAKSLTAARTLLTRYGDRLDGIFGEDDTMATAAGQVASETGRRQLKVVGIGGSSDGLSAIEDGSMAATTIQSPVQDGQLAVRAITKVLDGQRISANTYLDTPKVTKQNVGDFEPEW